MRSSSKPPHGTHKRLLGCPRTTCMRAHTYKWERENATPHPYPFNLYHSLSGRMRRKRNSLETLWLLDGCVVFIVWYFNYILPYSLLLIAWHIFTYVLCVVVGRLIRLLMRATTHTTPHIPFNAWQLQNGRIQIRRGMWWPLDMARIIDGDKERIAQHNTL